MSEGGAINRAPMLVPGEYAFWKNKMRAFLCSIDEGVWNTVLFGWSEPTTITGEGENQKTVPKPREDWSEREIASATRNSKGLNAIFNAVSRKDNLLVSTCVTSKEAWDKLATFYEGTPQQKTVKLQRLTTRFELLRMDESETFTEFYGHLSEILNESYALGEPISDSKVVRKILRSLPSRFKGKVCAIEESKDIDNLPLDELVGNLQTHEDGFESAKKTNLAYNTFEERGDQGEPAEVPTAEKNELSLLTQQFKKYMRYKKKKFERKGKEYSSKPHDDIKPYKKTGRFDKEDQDEVQCFKCQGFGHLANVCPSKKPVKRIQAMKATLDDTSSDSESSNSDNENSELNAFIATLNETEETVESENSEDEDDDVLEDDFISKERFSKVLENSKALYEENKVLLDKVLDLQEKISEYVRVEKDFKKEISDLKKEIGNRKAHEKVLDGEVSKRYFESKSYKKDLEAKIKEIESVRKELDSTKAGLSSTLTLLKKFEVGSSKLSTILNIGQLSGDRSGLGYKPHLMNDQKQASTEFVKATEDSETQPQNVGKPLNESKKTNKFCICSYCGFRGHERKECWSHKKVVNFYRNKTQLHKEALRGTIPKNVPERKQRQGMKKKVVIELSDTTKVPQQSSKDFTKVWILKSDLEKVESFTRINTSFKPRKELVNDCSTNN